MNIIDLGIDLHATFDPTQALNLTQAAKRLKTRKGHLHLEIVQRWANPERGCRPAGRDGPVLVLPMVRVGGRRLTMPAWVEAFEQMRQQLQPAA
jgi:hypothetical protein